MEINKTEIREAIQEMGGINNYVAAMNLELWMLEEKEICITINTPRKLSHIKWAYKTELSGEIS